MMALVLLWATGMSMAWGQAASGPEFLCSQPDTTPPVITCPPAQELILGPGCQATLPDYRGWATAMDDCPILPTITQSPLPGTLMSGPGPWNMSMLATDGAGNTRNCAFALQRRDTTRPQLLCPPSALEFTTWSQCRIPLYWPLPTVSDNCGGYFLTYNHVPGDTFSLGFHWIIYWIRDASGNRDSCQFARIVKAPRLDSAITALPALVCEGEPVTLRTLPGMAGYHWSSGGLDSLVTVSHSGWYWVDLTAPNQCIARDSFWLSTLPLPQPQVTFSGGLACTDSFAAYQWLLNGNPIPGGTGPCAAVLSDGDYAVIVTDSLGCTDTSATQFLLAKEPGWVPGFSIYPNPATDRIVLRREAPEMEVVQVSLLDLNGRPLRHWEMALGTNEAAWELGGLAAGAYCLVVGSNQGRRAVRLIVLRE